MASFLPLPTSIHSSPFDTPSSNGNDLQVYTRKKKVTVDIPPPVVSSNLGNIPLHFEFDEREF